MTPQRIATFLAILTLALSAHAARETYNFNPAWRLHIGDAPGAEARAFDDAAWKPVTLPRAWNEDDAFAKDIVDHRTGIAWYRKHFTLPKDVGQRKVFIEFEGARQAAEVWVNGQRIGLHENGITAFGFDLSRAVKPGDNLIAVRTDNRWDYREQATGQRYQWADRQLQRQLRRPAQEPAPACHRQALPDAAAVLQPRHHRRLRARVRFRHPGRARDRHRRGAGAQRA